jgi:colanic acid/amylovoran biosynthesis glycosyltransferase
MRQADVFLLTSVYEWLGVVLLEAQAIGLPIVATNVGGIPEAVSAGESAILVPPSNPRAAAEALAECLRHPEKREKMGLAGRKHVEEHFDIEVLNERLERFFGDLAGRKEKNAGGADV